MEIGRDVALINDPFAGGREGRLPALRDKANGIDSADNTPEPGLQSLTKDRQVEDHSPSVLPVRSVMLAPELEVRIKVHPLGLWWERLAHVGAAAKTLTYPLALVERSVLLALLAAFVGEIVAVSAQEVLACAVQLGHPPAAVVAVDHARTDESRPAASEVARRPAEPDRIPYLFPFLG